MNAYSYTHLIFDKGAKNIRWRIDSLFNKFLGKMVICLRKLKLACHPILVSTQNGLRTLISDPKL
jgi:hypothetical protein